MRDCYSTILGTTRLAVLDLIGVRGDLTAVHISRINVPRAFRGQGYGRELLRQACRDADYEGVTLYLSINPYGEPDAWGSFEDLEAWYGRYGFLPVKPGENWYRRTPRIEPEGVL